MRVLMKKILALLATSLLFIGCASPPVYAWVKNEASAYQRTNDESECLYQVRLNKTPAAQQQELHNLCMQSKGYRWKQVG